MSAQDRIDSTSAPPAELDGRSRLVVPTGTAVIDAPWFAIWTRSRAEKTVLQQLVRKDIETFLPTMLRVSRWKDRYKEVDWPLFPGYCFARFDPHNTLPVLTCAGVATIVSFNGVPAPVPHAEIEAVQRLVNSSFKFDPCPLIKEGDVVEVIHGPLTGAVGRLVKKGPHTKLVLSITMINRAVSVVFDAADVRKY
jgi:transcription antitermination factor NusG